MTRARSAPAADQRRRAAYGALIEDTKVAKGDFVFIPAASSSVGLEAIQLANYAGATTIALTSTYCREHSPMR